MEPRQLTAGIKCACRVAFGVIFLWAGHARAASSSSIPGYALHVWQTDDGLPQTSVNAVVQTRDGYVWVATYGGLARFDGERFTVFDDNNAPELQSRHVTSLFEAPDGALWIGNESGEMACYRDGRFRAEPIRSAQWSGAKIQGIGADASRDVWALNRDGQLGRVKDGKVLSPPPGTNPRLVVLTCNRSGNLWVQWDDQIMALKDGQLTELELTEQSTNSYVQGIGASRDGGLWVLYDNRIRKWKDGRWYNKVGSAPWGGYIVHSLLETRNGKLVAGTSEDGLFLSTPGGEAVHICRTNGFPTDWVTSLCQDREGNIWIATGNRGLAMLRAGNVTTLSPPDQWQGRALLSVLAGRDNCLWIGTEGAGLYYFSNGTWQHFGTERGLANSYVWSLAEGGGGKIWAGTWGAGLFVQAANRFQRPPVLEDLTTPVTALLASPTNGLWAGTGIGLFHYDDEKVQWLAEKPELVSPDVRAVRQTSDGTIWFGMSGGGLGCLDHGKLRQYRRRDGLSSDFIQCLHLEQDGTLWIGTYGGGLNRLRAGRFAAVTSREGLADDVICDIEDDGLGYFWISSHGGIMRVSKADLNRCADGDTNRLHCLDYTVSDGLPTLECSGGFQPSGTVMADGRLAFPTTKGLVLVDPREVRTNRLPPPVVIESVLVDDRAANAEATPTHHPMKIPPGRHRIEFRFAGLSFAAPEKVRFKCRLDALDSDWTDLGTRRSAHYSYLPPGDYTFRVIACNNDGVWNDVGASLAFQILPFFWETLWFRALVGAVMLIAAGGIVWLDTRRRMHRKLEKLERQQALERERARIAKDIHDDLGASLTRISMLSQSARGELEDPTAAGACLDQIYGTSRELTRAMGEIVWAVNPQHDTLDSLATYLQKFAQNFLRTANLRCRLDMPMELPHWTVNAEVRHNLYLAFKEALNNVVKHAAASEVRVSLKLEEEAFTLVIEDNGRGFTPPPNGQDDPTDPASLSSGSGLRNMQRRLQEVGGQCRITSTPGAGTRIAFFVRVKRS